MLAIDLMTLVQTRQSTQEAYRLPRSKYSLCCPSWDGVPPSQVGSTPHPDLAGGGGTPSQDGGYPVLGYPLHSDLDGRGTPGKRRWDQWKYYGMEMGNPPPPFRVWKKKQTETITFLHPSDAGGKNENSKNYITLPWRFISIPWADQLVLRNSIRWTNMGSVHFLTTLQMSSLPKYVKIVEVGPRDGLQNEKVHEFSRFNIFVEWRIFFKLHQVTPMVNVDNLSCDLYHSDKREQQP